MGQCATPLHAALQHLVERLRTLDVVRRPNAFVVLDARARDPQREGVRIATKLTIGLILTTSVVLGTDGYRQVRREERDLQQAAIAGMRRLGDAVEVAIENAVRDQQSADVQEILESLVRHPQVNAFVFDSVGTPSNPLGDDAHLALARSMVAEAQDRNESLVRVVEDADPPILVGVFPLGSDHGAYLGALALVRPLVEAQRDLAETSRAILGSIATLLAALSLIGSLLVMVYVRRPLVRLVVGMRSVRAGNLDASVDVSRNDELGQVAAEFNAMVRELAETRARLAAETESRESLEHGLQRVDKLVTIGQLSAGLAHEIGSPLQVLNGRARTLATRRDLAPDVHRAVTILVEQSDRITRIVEQLVHFARRRPTCWSEVDLAATIRPVCELLEPEARRRGIRLQLAEHGVLPLVIGDADKVQQVVLNLLKNALQATPRDGTVRLRLSSTPRPDSDQDDAVIAVEDSGPGVDAENAEEIFEPFFTTRASDGGTGLGLAIVKTIVTEHAGTITVGRSALGGACFTVRLPAATAQVARGLVA